MLGIDIGQSEIRMVNLCRRGGIFMLHGFVKIPFTAQELADVNVLGKMLKQALEQAGWSAEKAVMTLPRQHGFVRHFTAETLGPKDLKSPSGPLNKNTIEALLAQARQSFLAPADELIFDLFSSGEDLGPEEPAGAGNARPRPGVLIGAVQKKTVEFCRELAAAGEVKIQALELRALAAINGLLIHWQEAAEENIAVAYLEADHGDIGIMDSVGLLSLQSINFDLSDAKGPGDLSNGKLSEHLGRVFNTVRLSYAHCIPQRLFLTYGQEQNQILPAELVESLRQRLGIEVTLCAVEQGIITPKGAAGRDLLEFVPAIGAALDGLEVSSIRFDFLHPRGGGKKEKRRLSWKPFALVALAALLLTGVFWINLVQQKRQSLQEMQYQLGHMQPDLERTRQAREKWNLFHSFLPGAAGGTRRSYLSVMGEITRLFPDTNEAHVTRLEIIERPGSSAGYNISISGNVSESMVLNDFVARLNDSAMFQKVKQEGTTWVPDNLYYPYSFSVTSYLRPLQPGDDVNE